jgi:hypothetical protein
LIPANDVTNATYAFEIPVDDRRLERVQVSKPVCNILDKGQTVCLRIQLKVLWSDPVLVVLDDNAGSEFLLESNS